MADEPGLGTPAQAGGAIDAIRQRQSALSVRHGVSVDADRALVEALATAHAATVQGIRRLDAIEAEIDGAIRNQAALALDTPMGAREFQKFLIAKQQEISAVVTHTRDVGGQTRAAVHSLREKYRSPAG